MDLLLGLSHLIHRDEETTMRRAWRNMETSGCQERIRITPHPSKGFHPWLNFRRRSPHSTGSPASAAEAPQPTTLRACPDG